MSISMKDLYIILLESLNKSSNFIIILENFLTSATSAFQSVTERKEFSY